MTKYQEPRDKDQGSSKSQGTKSRSYDLISRCVAYAKRVREFVKDLPQTDANREYARQLVRSSSAVGANYIEANEALGKKDFYYRNRIARKEAKESRYWLELVDTGGSPNLQRQCALLAQEAHELRLIFSAIVRNDQ